MFFLLRERGVVILSPVMDNQLILREEETVTLDFPRSLDDLFILIRSQIRHIIDELPFIGTVGYDESELKAIILDDSTSEIVPFNHF